MPPRTPENKNVPLCGRDVAHVAAAAAGLVVDAAAGSVGRTRAVATTAPANASRQERNRGVISPRLVDQTSPARHSYQSPPDASIPLSGGELSPRDGQRQAELRRGICPPRAHGQAGGG